jgi:transposase InsO family protein
MAWKETVVVEERMKFVMACRAEEESMAALCREFGVSRDTGYKWLARYETHGVAGLVDRSRAPRSHPNAVDEATRGLILAARAAHPTWGPRKLRVLLGRTHRRRVSWPAASTIGELLRREGLSVPRKRRRRVERDTRCHDAALWPNDLWCIDFKGWFLTGDGLRCDPLTVTDQASRCLLRCRAMRGTGVDAVRPVLEAAFRELGLPRAIRSDNGAPFASRALAGLSPLSVWWIRLGIDHRRIDPGHPEQNGAHERMHRTLKGEAASPPARDARRQQERFDAFRAEFNDERPHEALGMETPSSRYEPSDRPYPARLPELEYARATARDGWEVRRVQQRGEFHWKNRRVFLSEVLAGEPVGLEPLDDRYWRAHFGPVDLGVFDSHRVKMLGPAARRRWERANAPPGPPPSAALRPSAPAGG